MHIINDTGFTAKATVSLSLWMLVCNLDFWIQQLIDNYLWDATDYLFMNATVEIKEWLPKRHDIGKYDMRKCMHIRLHGITLQGNWH